jgi:hypothetical protein
MRRERWGHHKLDEGKALGFSGERLEGHIADPRSKSQGNE